MSVRTIKLEIVSDVVCAWCYVGMARLHRALATRGEVAPVIAWQPFELNPSMPTAGMDRVAYFDAKFGSQSRGQVEERVVQAAAGEGLPMEWSRVRRMPNTRKAHLLIRHASDHQTGDAVHDALMRAHFAEGRDIGDVGILLDIASEQGLDRATAFAALIDPAQAEALARDQASVIRAGVSGVPFFVVSDRIAFSGAIETRDWEHVLRQATTPADAPTC
jgi:predicted DsbA family dithiol-disulfide isomerase